ncbi:aquaporin Z [Pseudoclavibacter caeni]|jgi:aquaporin Z|uniref:Aquaporin Z n=1 Tax=Pseudoclavibacter caeni TaxID=908846 RepID=A0A7C8FUN9_9MICO|nr:aquaporin Z [Pseudoclavibacter caeni]KAB1633474.1 aquaporin Z [Pseudoclavibacter caeni]NYJ96535.1 aquaporin Z [Pseudoclavibacter caeni]
MDTKTTTQTDEAQPRLAGCLGAEFLGTFLLVLGGTGTAVLAATVDHGVGYLGVALAFGLTVVVGAYAFGPVSGGHFNPAVSIGLATAGRFPWRRVPAYIAAQLVGAITASAVLLVIASGRAGFSLSAGFATNGYGAHSPEGYGVLPAFVTEFVLTAVFLLVIIGVTGRRAAAGFAPLAIGLTLTLIHLISIPVTNTSVNPARSIAPALFVGGDAIVQLWLFILAPVLGAVVAGLLYRPITGERD